MIRETPTKICNICNTLKSLDEFNKEKSGRDGRRTECRECSNKQSKKYYQDHREERKKYRKNHWREHKDEIRQKAGKTSMYENKLCPAYLGVVIAERLCKHLFKDVEVMPYRHSGYDIICNKNKKIDVKAGCKILKNKKYSHWKFNINNNTIADFFILVAFDNRTDLNPLHLWMISGHEVNKNASKTISQSTLHKWNQWERSIEEVQMCCTEMKNKIF